MGQTSTLTTGAGDLSASTAMSPRLAKIPLCVLRVARFAARYAHSVSVSPMNTGAVREMTAAGELEHLDAGTGMERDGKCAY